MALFQAIDPKAEVNGQTVLSVAKAFTTIKEMGYKLLEKHGFTDIKEEAWYPQQQWLDVFKEIHESMGESILLQIGKKIPENAKFPPAIDDAHKALASIDVAYHMNHRIGEEPLFNPATGAMKEGIGHYRYEKVGEQEANVICDNPYPDDFDKGIITAMTSRFATGVQVHVDESKGTREEGKEATTFNVKWNA